MNEILQWVAVVLVIAFAAVWIIRRIRRKPSSGDCASPCDGCALSNSCSTSKKKDDALNEDIVKN